MVSFFLDLVVAELKKLVILVSSMVDVGLPVDVPFRCFAGFGSSICELF